MSANAQRLQHVAGLIRDHDVELTLRKPDGTLAAHIGSEHYDLGAALALLMETEAMGLRLAPSRVGHPGLRTIATAVTEALTTP